MRLFGAAVAALFLLLLAAGSVSAQQPVTIYCGTSTVGCGTTSNPMVVTPPASVADPCQSAAKSYVAISQATNTQLVTATAAKKTYVCSILVIGADAENLSLVEGTGSTCGTGTAALLGGATAASGTNLAANGGFSHGSGTAAVAASPSTNTNICLFQSGSGRVAGAMSYVQN